MLEKIRLYIIFRNRVNLLIVALFKNNNNNYAEEYYDDNYAEEYCDEDGDGEYEDEESGIDGSPANTQYVTCIIICIIYHIIFTYIQNYIKVKWFRLSSKYSLTNNNAELINLSFMKHCIVKMQILYY